MESLLILIVLIGLYWLNVYRSQWSFYASLNSGYSNVALTNSNNDQYDFSLKSEQSLASQCQTQKYYIDLGLKKGMKGGGVSELQRFLSSEFALPSEDIVTGYFGSETERWLKELQTEKNLPSTGITNQPTLDAIDAETAAFCSQ